MATNGATNGRIPASWMKSLEDIPEPPKLTSERIKDLLSRALVGPIPLTIDETRELAASVVFHLMKMRSEYDAASTEEEEKPKT